MLPFLEALIFCFILAFNVQSQGMQFSMDRTPGSGYCGRLQCWVDKIFTDFSIFTIYSLTVYDVTDSNRSVKLASLSVFDPDLYVEQSKMDVVNVTGNVSWNHAELTLGLQESSYCLNGSFLCEMEFYHFSGQPDVIRETVTPGSSGNCPAVFSQVAQTAILIKAQSDQLEKHLADTEKDLGYLRQRNSELEQRHSELEQRNSELEQQHSELEQQNLAMKTEIDNLLHPKVTCSKGAAHNSSRETFLLWGKVSALCDTETDGGGWIVIQRRTKGDVDFNRGWIDYKNGFGTVDTDFWIGNDIISSLTSQGYTELRVNMEHNGTQYYAHYSHFDVAPETSLYRLSVSGYSGTASDSLAYHGGSKFSTFDKDNDGSSSNCASDYHGAWWYNNCHTSDLNGIWGAGDTTGLVWRGVVWPGSVTFSEIKVRHP